MRISFLQLFKNVHLILICNFKLLLGFDVNLCVSMFDL